VGQSRGIHAYVLQEEAPVNRRRKQSCSTKCYTSRQQRRASATGSAFASVGRHRATAKTRRSSLGPPREGLPDDVARTGAAPAPPHPADFRALTCARRSGSSLAETNRHDSLCGPLILFQRRTEGHRVLGVCLVHRP
jgi:hypothetical protein